MNGLIFLGLSALILLVVLMLVVGAALLTMLDEDLP